MFEVRGCNNAIYLDGAGAYAGYEDEYGAYGNLNKDAIKLQFFHQENQKK